jgi:hypothetical protein
MLIALTRYCAINIARLGGGPYAAPGATSPLAITCHSHAISAAQLLTATVLPNTDDISTACCLLSGNYFAPYRTMQYDIRLETTQTLQRCSSRVIVALMRYEATVAQRFRTMTTVSRCRTTMALVTRVGFLQGQ